MKIFLYQIDAFASEPFRGNPAAVCPLTAWLEAETMQAIAAENNLSETAFFVDRGAQVELRWFTPTTEVDLCGHATLAAAFVILEHLRSRKGSVVFSTRSGTVEVHSNGELLVLDLPAHPAEPCEPPPALLEGLKGRPAEVLLGNSYLAVFASEAEVRELVPRFDRLSACHPRAVIATAPGTDTDFVSRYFAPSFGIDEDPVTGSAHCTLTPYWSRRLGRTRLAARQVSARGGELRCEDLGERVAVAGRCVLYLHGEIELPRPSRP